MILLIGSYLDDFFYVWATVILGNRTLRKLNVNYFLLNNSNTNIFLSLRHGTFVNLLYWNSLCEVNSASFSTCKFNQIPLQVPEWMTLNNYHLWRISWCLFLLDFHWLPPPLLPTIPDDSGFSFGCGKTPENRAGWALLLVLFLAVTSSQIK